MAGGGDDGLGVVGCACGLVRRSYPPSGRCPLVLVLVLVLARQASIFSRVLRLRVVVVDFQRGRASTFATGDVVVAPLRVRQ